MYNMCTDSANCVQEAFFFEGWRVVVVYPLCFLRCRDTISARENFLINFFAVRNGTRTSTVQQQVFYLWRKINRKVFAVGNSRSTTATEHHSTRPVAKTPRHDDDRTPSLKTK